MSATYNMPEEEETIQWEIDMNCAADIHGLDQWSRGQVCKIVSENMVEVTTFGKPFCFMVGFVSLRMTEWEPFSIR